MLILPGAKGTRHTRSIYSVWDAFANIGGLVVFLWLIAYNFVQLLTESSIFNEINSNLFYKKPDQEIYENEEKNTNRGYGLTVQA